jgi:hypothetical protein
MREIGRSIDKLSTFLLEEGAARKRRKELLLSPAGNIPLYEGDRD